MEYVTTVRVLMAQSRKPLVNIKVALYDRDEKSDDDLLGTGHTNAIGEVDFRYATRDFADGALKIADEGALRINNSDTVPDLYVVVYNGSDEVILSTRDQATSNKASSHVLVLLDEALAQAHRLAAEI